MIFIYISYGSSTTANLQHFFRMPSIVLFHIRAIVIFDDFHICPYAWYDRVFFDVHGMVISNNFFVY